jgi:hypothetical protein
MDDPVATPLPAVTGRHAKRKRLRGQDRRPAGRPAEHGGAMLTRVLRSVPFKAIHGSTKVGVYMRRLRRDLVDQLGGDVTPAQMRLIEMIAKKAVIEEVVGNYVLTRDSLVDDQGALLSVVMQHDTLATSLARLLALLGLERKPKDIDLVGEIAQLQREAAAERQRQATPEGGGGGRDGNTHHSDES